VSHPQLEKLADIIRTARWVDGMKNAGVVTDAALANRILEAGFTAPDPGTPSVLLSPCCGERVYARNGWDGCDASIECPNCQSEWDAWGEVSYWLAKSE
jgi:hypothetical protein